MRQRIALIALALLAVPAFAQDAYPSRPITMVVAFPPGGVAELTGRPTAIAMERSEEHTSELQSRQYLVCRLLLEKKKKNITTAEQYLNILRHNTQKYPC